MDPAEAYFHLGNKLQTERRLVESVAAYQKALEFRPNVPAVLNNLGGALKVLNRLDESIQAYKVALSVEPHSATLHSNLGGALYQQGRFAEAMTEFRHALSLDANFAAAQGSLGIALLQHGNMSEGWPLYDGRFVLKRYADPRFTGPFWDGSPLDGKRLLLRAEQGFGDTIQFIRYAPLVKAQGGRVILACPPELRRLLRGQCGIDEIVCKGEELPQYDVQFMLLSLPRLCGTTLETIPADVPYLKVSADLLHRWEKRKWFCR
jgi:tetratricopeptide (TPR) repeat protein